MIFGHKKSTVAVVAASVDAFSVFNMLHVILPFFISLYWYCQCSCYYCCCFIAIVNAVAITVIASVIDGCTVFNVNAVINAVV